MEIRKYLFWMTAKGIQTYKVTQKGTFKLVYFKGEERYTDTDITKFIKWFNKYASITEDEYIDFCYLSDHPIDSSLFQYKTKEKSSWDKKEISIFCAKYMNIASYEIVIDAENSFVCQTGNLTDGDKITKIYLKCLPEFSLDTVERIDPGSEETSLLSKYFIERLKEIEDV